MDGAIFYFSRTYDETMNLLIEARNYAAYHHEIANCPLPPDMRFQVNCEALRVTSRLLQVMAWLLAQRAVHDGELTPERGASDEFALSGGAICSDASGPENEALPNGLRGLLSRSHSLYLRVSRLEDQVRRQCPVRVAG